jgi:hypothetical protein
MCDWSKNVDAITVDRDLLDKIINDDSLTMNELMFMINHLSKYERPGTTIKTTDPVDYTYYGYIDYVNYNESDLRIIKSLIEKGYFMESSNKNQCMWHFNIDIGQTEFETDVMHAEDYLHHTAEWWEKYKAEQNDKL